jgi:hypothetical protein
MQSRLNVKSFINFIFSVADNSDVDSLALETTINMLKYLRIF